MDLSQFDQETLDKLATGEYSISPRSGRLRKKIKLKKKKSAFFSKSRLKKQGIKALWVLLVLAFLASLIIVLPELDLNSGNKKINQEKTKAATQSQ